MPIEFKCNFKKIFITLVLIAVIIGVGVGGFLLGNKEKKNKNAPENKYIAFINEVYDRIQQDHWKKLTDERLSNLYVLATEKVTGQSLGEEIKDRQVLKEKLTQIINELDTQEKKQEFTATLTDVVLTNLQPAGRSRLYTQKLETDLKNNVENRNPDVDQYQILAVEKNASYEEIDKAYQQKIVKLEGDQSSQAKEQLTKIEKAHTILADKENRKIYDQAGVEPTMEYRLLTDSIFYLHLNKLSPTTVDELLRVTQKVNQGDQLDTLILDLRDNVGGAIDNLPYFLGPFIGQDQYAYQFLKQGKKTDFKTKIGWLPSLMRYKKIIVLINENTQSSAEVMVATIKKYNVGVVVGTTTKGWGTVERVFEIKNQISETEKYSVFLVHNLTLREDGQTIEGQGVEPTIDINKQGWEKELYQYFNSEEIVSSVKQLI